ncbi:MAG: metal-dependent hydrolase [Candidatus Methanoperedens sp.]|nr:metal-dependent hydrolase [Candidatus Methanoperedens sp.]
MDLFTHALIPYLLGNYLKKRKEEIAAFVIGGIAPDFDIFLLFIQYIYPTFFLITHRGITHSLFFGLFTCIIILYLASRLRMKKRIQKHFDFDPGFTWRTIAYAYSGVLIHLFLDYSTTRGVPLLFPLETTRYSAELFFYTDIFLTLVSLGMVIFLFKRPFKTVIIAKFLVIFLIVFSGLGAMRLVEKNNLQEFFKDGSLQSFPSVNPFTWYVLKEERDNISIFEYDGLEGRSDYNLTVPRLNIISSGDGLNMALGSADKLPQLKMFRWRAHAVALNASYGNGTWSLEYYDPLQRIEMRGISSTFRRAGSRFGSLNISVTGDKALVSD